jgi:hypothetical protein
MSARPHHRIFPIQDHHNVEYPDLCSVVAYATHQCVKPVSNVDMADLYPSLGQCAIVATALKILLFPA